MRHPIATERAVGLLGPLVAINSVNPAYGGPGERQLAGYLANYLTDLGLRVETYEVLPNRPNVVARLERSPAAPTVMLETHMDTVPAEGMEFDPFGAQVYDGKLYGRGACDAKGSLVSMLLALRSLADEPPECNVVLAAVVDEEAHFAGSRALVDRTPPVDGVIVGEPTGLAIVTAHKGVVRCTIEVRGRSAHSAHPSEGINAIFGMAEVVRRLQEQVIPALQVGAHQLVDPPTLSVGVIHGGTAVNTVPDRCAIEIDRRLVPGETPDQVWEELKATVEGWNACGVTGIVTVHPASFTAWPMETDRNAPIIRTMVGALHAITGRADIQAAVYTTDGSEFARAGMPCVVFGPGSIGSAHSATEHVILEEVLTAAQVLERAARTFGEAKGGTR